MFKTQFKYPHFCTGQYNFYLNETCAISLHVVPPNIYIFERKAVWVLLSSS